MDTHISLWIHSLIPLQGLFGSLLTILTTFGSTYFIFFFVTFLSLILALRGRFNKAHMVIVAAVFASISSSILKWIVKRPRPELWPHPINIDGYSFPSGHALVTTVVFGICAYLFAENRPHLKKIIYPLCGLFILLIGLSRVVMGVHYPSDVVAGWIFGGLILYVMIWWYKHGGIKRTLRIIFGLLALIFGLIGVIIPIIPGIPLLIGAFILIFSSKPLGDIFKPKQKTPASPYGDGKVIDITPNLDGSNKDSSGK